MARRTAAPLIILALLLALGTTAAACGGDDLTLEEYFQRMETLDDAANERFEPLVEALDQEFESEADQVEATRAFFNADIPILRDFVDALDDLDPPTEVEDPHEEFVAAGRDQVDAFQDLTGRMTVVESISELEELLDDPELDAASDRFDKACFELQEIAADNGIAFDLGCEDEE